MLPDLLMRLLLTTEMLTESFLRGYAGLINWKPVGRSVSITVTEGEPEIFGMTVMGIIRNINDVVIIELDSPWHYPNRTTSVTDWILVQPRFLRHTAYRLLLGSWHVNVYPVVDQNNPTAFVETEGIAICEVRLLRRH